MLLNAKDVMSRAKKMREYIEENLRKCFFVEFFVTIQFSSQTAKKAEKVDET